ncbi:sugar-binding protein, partial [Tenacibaculum finnmarkense]|uniref:RHS repeat domain-containing protein n=1 Tax=Tenacibaculum finnmarkense TaxID=2781243 RepID=UPI001EFBBE43
DHLGTPTSMYNEEGETTWVRSLDSNGKVREGDNSSCPFLFQGQYYDDEIELAYNRFRYYDPEDGRYISKDPIGLLSGEFGFYNYVHDTNSWIDEFGLHSSYKLGKNLEAQSVKRPDKTAAHHIVGSGKSAKPAKDILTKHGIDIDSHKNGVFLPRKGSTAPGHKHTGKHLDSYVDAVNKDIIKADKLGGKPAVEKQLDKIRQGLLDKSYTPLQK